MILWLVSNNVGVQYIRVLFVSLFYSGFASLSTIFQSYRYCVWIWQGAKCSVLECCLTEISLPRHLPRYSTKSHYNFNELTISDFQLYFLNAAHQAKELLVPFLKSLAWLGRGSNLQPPGHKADALPTELLCWSIHLGVTR